MKKENKISTVLTVLNEEKKIEACLSSVRWVDEIIVVDDGSTDGTVAIAKKFTGKIFKHKSRGYVEPARNFAISKATGDWILLIDADERVPESLTKRLREISLLEKEAAGVLIPRKNFIFSKWIQHTGWWPDYQLRFFRKGAVIWPDTIHKQPEPKGSTLELDAKEENSLIHFHYETVNDYLRKMNNYTTVEANDLVNVGNNFNWTDFIEKPFNEFLSRFFARGGYKDGLHGLVLALLQAISMFVVVLKVWEKNGFEEVDAKELFSGTEKEVGKMRKELLFWFSHEKIENIKNPVKKNAYKLLKKFVE